MYRLLLSWRYLKTRFIALASIVSVTLGVATLIVVNGVMAGFIDEMQDRLHGILSDVEIASPGLGEIGWPELHVQEIERIVGDDIQAITYVVRVPALLNFQAHGRQWTQQVILLGIDERTFGQVTDFNPYLTNTDKQAHFDFTLAETGYPDRFGGAGWPYRRGRAETQQKLRELIGDQYEASLQAQSRFDHQVTATRSDSSNSPRAANDQPDHLQTDPAGPKFAPLPEVAPKLVNQAAPATTTNPSDAQTGAPSSGAVFDSVSAFDPHSNLRPQIAPEQMFNPARDQHTGIVLGIAIASRQFLSDDGQREEFFMVRPGDDVQITLPTAGSSPQPITENCTIVDFYSSNMHEYDSSFAFMSLRKLQEIRQMIDPVTGASTVSAIQIKLKPGVDLNAVRDKLIQAFPPEQYPYVIQTWEDTQRPLLSAIHMEVTILNLLLFLIIAVAGFGILATFFMIVVEKTRDIGILKALGAPSNGVMAIFLNYGFALGTVGTGVGIVLGLLLVYFINDIADGIQYITGQEIFDPTIYYFSEIPTIISPWMIVWVAAGAILIAVLASVLPALRAARLHPVEALRYE